MADYSYGSSFEKELHNDIKNLIETGYDRPRDDTEFNDISLRLFRFQYENCELYRKFCESKDLTPSNVNEWRNIPAIPAEAFKYNDIACFPLEKAKYVFMTSGTKDPNLRGKSYRDDSNMELLELVYHTVWRRYALPDKRRLKGLMMSPSPELLDPSSSITLTIGMTANILFSEDVEWVIGAQGIDIDAIVNSSKQAEATGDPVMFIGPSFGFIPLFDALKEKGIKFQLPDGSRLCDGAGFKGKSREISKEEFLSLSSELFGIPYENLLNQYACTELTSIFIDNVLINKIHGISEPKYKPNHPWTRTIVVDPNTLSEPVPQRLPAGERGVVRFYELTNKSTVMAIQTEDIGCEINDGFEIFERARGIGGCSLAIEEFLEASK